MSILIKKQRVSVALNLNNVRVFSNSKWFLCKHNVVREGVRIHKEISSNIFQKLNRLTDSPDEGHLTSKSESLRAFFDSVKLQEQK